jgi:hypothetical protein
MGGCSRDDIGVTYQQGNGLKLWADLCVGHRSRPPILEGKQTVLPGGSTGVCHGPHRGKTVTKSLALSLLGLPLSEKQIPQVIEKYESGEKPKEALERAAVRVKQAL